VRLEQDPEPQVARGREQRPQLRPADGRGDQQHRVGAGRAGLDQLRGMHQEVLPQQREIDGAADGLQIRERSAEVTVLREDGDRRGAGVGVRARLDDGVAIGDLARRRRRALHLGDHRGRAASERVREGQRRRPRAGAREQRRVVERTTVEVAPDLRDQVRQESHEDDRV
jgi:hypothetical protein